MIQSCLAYIHGLYDPARMWKLRFVRWASVCADHTSHHWVAESTTNVRPALLTRQCLLLWMAVLLWWNWCCMWLTCLSVCAWVFRELKKVGHIHAKPPFILPVAEEFFLGEWYSTCWVLCISLCSASLYVCTYSTVQCLPTFADIVQCLFVSVHYM